MPKKSSCGSWMTSHTYVCGKAIDTICDLLEALLQYIETIQKQYREYLSSSIFSLKYSYYVWNTYFLKINKLNTKCEHSNIVIYLPYN